MTNRIKTGFLFAAVALLLFRSDTQAFNHPEINWKTVKSDHFLVHYYDKTEPLALPALGIAEGVYDFLKETYGPSRGNKIDIVLADYDDMSNGFADWLGGGVEIWTPDMSFPFRGSTTWLRNVITHELTHIFSLRKTDGMQFLDFSATVDIIRPGYRTSVGKIFPQMKLAPSWLAEGVAQSGAYRCSNDCWDSRRDMVLRCAVLDGKELSLDQMGVFAHDQLGNELVYNQGFSFVRYLENTLGKDKVAALVRGDGRGPWDAMAGFEPTMFSALHGHDLSFYYAQWRDSAQNAARRLLPARATEGAVLLHRGRFNLEPRFSANGAYWGALTGNHDDSYRTDLVVMRTGSADPVRTITNVDASWDFSNDGAGVFYISSYYPGDHGSFFKELMQCRLSDGRVTQLTKNGRIYALSVSPDGKEIATVRFHEGRFTLEMFDLASRKFSPIDRGTAGNPYVGLDFDPAQASRFVVERVVDGISRLFIVDLRANTMQLLTNTKGREESPYWARSGRIYYSADYDGIFNIYSVKPDGSDRLRHTSVKGGAFTPALTQDENRLIWSDYASSGFRVVSAPMQGVSDTLSGGETCTFSPVPTFSGEAPVPGPYQTNMLRASWESMAAVANFTDSGSSLFGVDVGVVRRQNDALGKVFTFLGGDVATGFSSGWSGGSIGETAGFTESVRQSGARTARWRSYIDSTARTEYSYTDRFLRREERQRTMPATSSGERNGAASGGTPIIQMQPMCGVAVNTLCPSIQTVAALSLVNIIPVMLLSQSEIAWQTGRSTYAGLSPDIRVVLLKLLTQMASDTDTVAQRIDDSLKIAPAGAALPLWITWQHIGYYNEDLAHNYNNLSECSFELTPSAMPGGVESNGELDYSKVVKGISGSVRLFHGFPLSKYAGVPVSLGASLMRYGFPVNSTFIDTQPLPGNSDLYLSLKSSASLCFPIARKLDHGRRLFFDALYGRIGYSFASYANREFLVRLQDSAGGRSLFSAGHDDGCRVSHYFFISAEINSLSEFMFASGLDITIGYEAARRLGNLSVVWVF